MANYITFTTWRKVKSGNIGVTFSLYFIFYITSLVLFIPQYLYTIGIFEILQVILMTKGRRYY